MIPDVVGLPLEDARERLTAAGIDVGEVVETRPKIPSARPQVEGPTAAGAGAAGGPKAPTRKRDGLRIGELTGRLRVVRVRGEGPVALVVTRERYLLQPPAP